MIVMMVCDCDREQPMGGLQKQGMLLARTLIGRGEDVVMLSSTRSPARAGATRIKGVPTRLFWTYTSPQRAGRHMPAALIWALQLFIWIAINRKRISALHVHEIRIHAFVAALARKWFKIPTVMKSALGGEKADLKVIGSKRFWGARGRRFVIRHTDRFIATTSTIADDLKAWGASASQVRVIPNGAELPPPPDLSAADNRARRFVFLGRLHDGDKNILAMTRAFLRASASRDITLDIYGMGPDEGAVRRILMHAGHGGVALKGWAEDARELLPRYGYLLLPSHREGLSNAMIEAMGAGVVPVVTNVSGASDHIVPGENGRLIASPDEDDIAEAVGALGALEPDAWARTATQARRYAEENFSIERVGAAYQELYAELERREASPVSGLQAAGSAPPA